MILKQYYLGCLSQASYLVGDAESGKAVVVDPRRDVELYQDEARRLGLSIAQVFLTHFHADFVSGHLELAARTGAAIRMGARARADYPFVPARDGERIDLGGVAVEVLETPGHTPESLSLLVHDLSGQSPRAHAVLTGDALFIGDVGRPDLLVSAGMSAEELAGMLYDSLRQKLLPLPGEVLVYPAHGAGSACGRSLSSESFATLASQKASNWALQPMSKAEFVRALTADQPSVPGYFTWDADYNRRQRPMLEEVVRRSQQPLELAQVLQRVDQGAILLDVREADAYAALHLRGSVNVGLSGRFAGWVGSVLPREARLVVLAEDGKEAEALTRLARIGYDHVEGLLGQGAAALERCPERVARHPRLGPSALSAALGGSAPPLVLDVRARSEWEAGHIQGSLNLPLPELERRLDELPRGPRVVVQCQGGYRSSIAASLMERRGLPVAGDLHGGFAGWQAAGLAWR